LAQKSAQDSFMKNQWETFPLGEASVAHTSKQLKQVLGRLASKHPGGETLWRRKTLGRSTRVSFSQNLTRFGFACPGFIRIHLGQFFAW